MVVFFDIDGTIVDDRSQIIPDSCIDGVRRLRANGHIPVINTGRPLGHIDPRIRTMEFEGFICGCGSEVILDGELLHRSAPGEDLCRYAVQSARDCRMGVIYEADEDVCVDGIFSDIPRVQRLTGRLRENGVPVREIRDKPGMAFLKFVTFNMDGSRTEEFLRLMEPYFTSIDRENGIYEHVVRGCSKAKGMEVLLEALKIPREDTLAIGDSTNDLPMFRAAGHTACIGGGAAALQAAAEFVTAPVLEDGVYKALEHFGLI